MLNKIFLNDRIIILLIIINAIIIFLGGFKYNSDLNLYLIILDNFITILFITEAIVKINYYGKDYFKSNWNKFDFTLIILSLPSLLTSLIDADLSSFSFLLVLRILRLFKTFRFFKFVPGIEQLLKGIQRALKASVIVILGLIIYIFIIGVLSFYLFNKVAPEYFENPLMALYSTFKIFTVEGWYEIPEVITLGMSKTKSFFTYLYFIFILLTGGIFGLSLVNSIFVDAMVSDNNDDLERKIDLLDEKISKFIEDK